MHVAQTIIVVYAKQSDTTILFPTYSTMLFMHLSYCHTAHTDKQTIQKMMR